MLLGFIAGVTILLGLPIGRLRSPAPTLRALLNARPSVCSCFSSGMRSDR